MRIQRVRRRFRRRVLRSWPDLLRPNSWPGRREAAMRPDHHESPQPAIGPGPWRAYAQSGCDMPWDGASLSGSRPRDGQGDGVSASDAASPQARMRHPYPARGCDPLGVVAGLGGSQRAWRVSRRLQAAPTIAKPHHAAALAVGLLVRLRVEIQGNVGVDRGLCAEFALARRQMR